MNRPDFSPADAARLVRELYGIDAEARELPGETDRNFHLSHSGGRAYVLKIAGVGDDPGVLRLQVRALRHLATSEIGDLVPRVLTDLDGRSVPEVSDRSGRIHRARLLTFLAGNLFADTRPHDRQLLEELGRRVAALDRALADFSDPALHRRHEWDLCHLLDWWRVVPGLEEPSLVEPIFRRFARQVAPVLSDLPAGPIHSDVNDWNVLVGPGDGDGRIVGLIDFSDLVHTATVCEVAVTAAYAMLFKDDPVAAAAAVLRGYHAERPLGEAEHRVLPDLVRARLAQVVCIAAHRRQSRPESPMTGAAVSPTVAMYEEASGVVSERPSWDLLRKLTSAGEAEVRRAFVEACPRPPRPGRGREELLAARRQSLGTALSLSYRRPLEIVRGSGAWLFDADGRAYLDCVNNVNHVGHSHPAVVEAARRQMAVLNTNTRYLHHRILEYAERLTSTLPEPLRVCFFVSSGSEANDLALRLARTHTGHRDVVVVDGAYHGWLGSLVELSPYKFDGPGGSGRAPHVHQAAMPDVYRGPYKADDPQAGRRYADDLRRRIGEAREDGRAIAAFFCESLLSCGGQIPLPDGYLRRAAADVREAGGVYVADEVQVGFGRVGTRFWGFELGDVVPDIVTMGKPIGNGHPLAAVVTTPEIAASFDNGMEYFNTYGGNPVSCAVGLAVLDLIEKHDLQRNALEVGTYLKSRLGELKDRHALIGDVRGRGLFLGIELVRDRRTLEPAAEEGSLVLERMKDRGVLLSTDGPLHNVLKIKPPLVFSQAQADLLVDHLEAVLLTM